MNGVSYLFRTNERVLARTDEVGVAEAVLGEGFGEDAGRALVAGTVGEAVGTCAKEIPAEQTLGAHVHVEATRGDAVIDVMELLGEEE